jgi:Gram-negative bacterial TonB protein C-terminal
VNGFSLPARPLLFVIWCVVACSQISAGREKTISIGDAVEHALTQSQLTLPGSPAFHLKAQITNSVNPASDYKAEIEEYWLFPEHWLRRIDSPAFSQTLVVDGDKISEQNQGDYYPFWLRNLVTAIFDPLPMREQLLRFNGELELPTDSAESNSCLQFSSPAGVPPVRASIPYRFCFRGKSGRLEEVITPGYKAHFDDYKPFKGRMVPRRITADLAPDAILEAKITQLDDVLPPDRTLFTVDQPTPQAEQLKSTQVSEGIARKIAVAAPEISWPPVREGKATGTLTIYISADKLGQVREVWPVASDNPELNAAAREQVQHWRFQPYVNGVPMQMESVLTFAFNAVMGPPIPLLSNAAARKLATHIVEPTVPPRKAAKGTRFTLRIRVDEEGKLVRIQNLQNAKAVLAAAGERALKQWQFHPYLRDGRPDRFDADIVLTVR